MAWRRPVRLLVFWSVAVSLILAAVLVGLIQHALPWWASDVDRVARVLSSRLGTPVTIEQALPEWNARGPVVELRGVRFGADADAQGARIERATWAIDFSGLIRPGRRFSEFRVHGVDITLEKQPDGRWEVLGLPELLRAAPTRPLAEVLRALPAFALRDSRLTIRHAPDRPGITLLLAELVGVDGGDEMRWRGRLMPDSGVEDATATGEIILALDVAGDGSGRGYIEAKSLALSTWLDAIDVAGLHPVDGRLIGRIWAGFTVDGLRDVQFEIEQEQSAWALPSDADSNGEDPMPAIVPALSFGGRWQRKEGTSVLLVDGLAFGDDPPGRIRGQLADGLMRFRAEGVTHAPLGKLATVTDAMPEPIRRWLRVARPQGVITALDVVMDDQGFRQAAAHLEGLTSAAANGAPGITGLSTRFRADRDGIVLHPRGAGIVLDYPGVFENPVVFDVAGGAIAAWRDDDNGEWAFSMDQLAIAGPEFRAAFAGGMRFPDGLAIEVDLGARVEDTAVEAVKAFWPINRMRNSSRWLNRSLKGGRIVSGDAWIRGPVDAFPFRNGGGRLDAIATVVDAGLDYHPDWPAIDNVRADLVFENEGMRIVGETLRVAGMVIEDVRAEVPDLKTPILDIRAKTRATGEQLFAFVESSPLQARYGRQLEGMRIEGTPLAEVRLTLPLKRKLGESTVDGRLVFAGESFTDAQRDLAFGDVQGALQFTRHGVGTRDMKLTLAGEPAELDLRIGRATLDETAELEAELSGHLSAGAIFGRIDALAPVVAAADGQADWSVDVVIPKSDDADVPRVSATGRPSASGAGVLRVESDLVGIELGLPAPLAKERGGSLPLRLSADTATVGRRIDLRLGQLLHLDARLASPGRPLVGAIALGGASPEQLPDAGLVVTGQVPALDLGGWLALDDRTDASVASDEKIAWPRVILRAGELGVLGRGFRDVDLQMQPGADGVEVRLAGPDIEGTISWGTAAAGRVVRGRFARVHVPPAGAGAGLGASLPPSAIPALDIATDDLRVGRSVLGRTRLISHPKEGAYHIATFESRSDAFELDATGDWRRAEGRDESDLDIELRADDLGRMLESFGFAGLIEGGRTTATIDGRWEGSPAAFALERIDGTLDVDVEAGRILDVDPGMGRLFGLLNLREIPRRLILDFRDFFSQGMRFNSIQGRFALNVGDAYTDNMVLKSPSADILITGRTGLIMRDYDQTLEVSPRMGGTLPVVGAIAGGPAGAAAGLVVQGLLRIDNAAKIIYRVTGPWDEPVIIKEEPVARAAGRERSDATSMEPSS